MENVESQESGKSGVLKFFAIVAAVIVMLIVIKLIIG
jgi:hypothetical protein